MKSPGYRVPACGWYHGSIRRWIAGAATGLRLRVRDEAEGAEDGGGGFSGRLHTVVDGATERWLVEIVGILFANAAALMTT